MPLTQEQREIRELQKHLKELTTAVRGFLAGLDRAMEGPSTVERGRAIGRLAGALELANDRARYFGMGIDYRTDRKDERAGQTPAHSHTTANPGEVTTWI